MLRFIGQVSRRFARARDGAVLVYVAFSLPILMGVMALSIDLGRGFILNTELKNHADAAALTGAAELDGKDGARARAKSAALTGIGGTLANYQAFATDGLGSEVEIVEDRIQFLRRLPADGTNFAAGDIATSDADARFIYVEAVPRSMRNGLSRAVAGALDFSTSGKAIAGYSSLVCRLPAMFMCNPLEDSQFPVPPAAGCITGTGAPVKGQEECMKGRQMLMKTAGGGAGYVPGNFGLLDPPTGNQGANAVADLIATAAPSFCVSTHANLRTGQAMGPIQSAINTRFDMYSNPQFGGNTKNDPQFRPSLNVTKGYTGSGCSSTLDETGTAAKALPRDECFYSDSCAQGRFGEGDWRGGGNSRADEYWTINHGAAPIPAGYYDTMTRYDVYRHEIDTELDNQQPGIVDNSATNGEYGKPQCYTPGDPDNPDDDFFYDPSLDENDTGLDEIDRRVMVMSVVNCVEHGPLSGNEDGVPVEGFIEIFLTEPAQGNGSDQADIYGEIKGVFEPGESEALKDIVQLYR